MQAVAKLAEAMLAEVMRAVEMVQVAKMERKRKKEATLSQPTTVNNSAFRVVVD